MGRRKLTHILYEVCGTNALLLRNAQSESPRDIALRKGLKSIIDILNMPPVLSATASIDGIDESSSKHNHQRSSSGSDIKPSGYGKGPRDPGKNKSDSSKKNWSPYGCHYFPDPRTFPAPKMETLPKEPLQNGEQYFLDLAGNIRKGPVGIGHTCYCKPFFHHIEQKISKSKPCFKEYTLDLNGSSSSSIIRVHSHTVEERMKRSLRYACCHHICWSSCSTWKLTQNDYRVHFISLPLKVLDAIKETMKLAAMGDVHGEAIRCVRQCYRKCRRWTRMN